MTTLELIERGVGANCLSDAYDLGRADEQLQSIEDAKQQATEYLNALNKAKEEAYEQGKADGIDECINLIKMCCPTEEVSSFGLLVCGLEKLKEQSNE